jgi:hypothetical protein
MMRRVPRGEGSMGISRIIGKQIHFDGAKDVEVVLEIVGMGPATATPAEEK